MQRAPHPPKGFIPSEGWASGSQGHPWSPTDTPAAGRRPIAGLPRPPTAPPSASAAAHRPLRGHRWPPPQRRTALPKALGGRRRRGGCDPGTGRGVPSPRHRRPPPAPLRAGPLAPSMRRGGRGAPRREGGGAERGRVRAEGDGQGGDTGDKRGRGHRQGRERSRTRMRNVRERSRGAELKRLRGGPSDSPKQPADVAAAGPALAARSPSHPSQAQLVLTHPWGRPPGASL